MNLLKTLLIIITLTVNGFVSLTAFGAATDSQQHSVISVASQQLVIEKSRNALAQKLQTLQQTNQKANPGTITTSMLQRANLAISLAKQDLDGINLTLTNAQQGLAVTQASITALANQLAASSTTQQVQLQKQLEEQQQLRKLQQARIHVLQRTQNLAQQTLLIAQNSKSQLQDQYQSQQQQIRQQALEHLALSLQTEQQEWLTRLAKLNQQLANGSAYSPTDNDQYAALEMGVFEAEERSNLSQIQLDLARLHNDLENLSLVREQNLNLTALNNAFNQADNINQQLKNIQTSLQDKITLLQKRIHIATHSIDDGILSPAAGQNSLDILYGLLNSYQNEIAHTQQLSKQAADNQNLITQQLKQHIASRQGLPGWNWQAWSLLGERLLQTPTLTWQSLLDMQKPILARTTIASIWQWLLWGAAFVLWVVVWQQLHRLLKIATRRQAKRYENMPADNLFSVFLELLKRFLPGFMLLGGLIGLLLMLNITLQSFSLLLGLIFIVLLFGFVIDFARIILLENTTDKSGHDVRLYYRLKWALSIGGLITAVTFLVHQLPVSYSVQDLFGRLFMLFLLIVAFVLLRGCNILPTALAPYLENKPRYLKQAVRLLSLLVPLTIFSNALVGLIGYVELAWAIAAYQGLFLVVLTGFLLVRGLVGEIMGLVAGQIIRRLRNGWLWSEAILKPLHQILKIIIFFGAIAVLFALYGWGWNSWATNKIWAILNVHLFTLAGSSITCLSIVELFLILMVLIWAAKWTREFAYRWLFAHTHDLGLRNSLSIFTQYTLVAIGVLVGLNIIGINLTALTFVASAFALGVGFGLRDLANNFVSGILLLIERPVRVGDYVTLANFDGTVAHIGMRSITVRTDNHQELLVPNASVFAQSFINWTRNDNIVRVTLNVKINRIDDTHKVRDVILDVLKSMPKILTAPPSNVYLKNVEDILLLFEVEYYLDLRSIPSRSVVRSQFLFALWDRFKTEGIHAPETSQEIILREKIVEKST